MNSHLIIRLCRHTFPNVRNCQGPAVRGRAWCRHHLDARTRRLACIPRLRVPMTPRDLALNRAEVLRVVTAGGVDLATARMLLWAMDLTAAALLAEPTTRPRRFYNPNVFYYVPISSLFSQGCTETPSQVTENTRGTGEGYHLVPDLQPQTGIVRASTIKQMGIQRVNLLSFTDSWRPATEPHARFESR